jgi:hypothetical protein
MLIMSTRIKNNENYFLGENPVLKRLMERGFRGVSLPRFTAIPEFPNLLQEKFHLKTHNDLRIVSRFESGWVHTEKHRLNIAPIWRLISENNEKLGKK